MPPTTEKKMQRVFNVLRKDKTLFKIPADTVCENRLNDASVELTFKRCGKPVGRLNGPFVAWWIDCDEGSKTYHIEVVGHMIEVVADTWHWPKEDDSKHVLKSGDVEVAVIYSRLIDVSWYEDRA